MPSATITSKGQTTIPKAVRDRLRLKAGDRVEFIVQDDGTALIVPTSMHVSELEGLLAPSKRKVSVEEMRRAIRKRGARR